MEQELLEFCWNPHNFSRHLCCSAVIPAWSPAEKQPGGSTLWAFCLLQGRIFASLHSYQKRIMLCNIPRFRESLCQFSSAQANPIYPSICKDIQEPTGELESERVIIFWPAKMLLWTRLTEEIHLHWVMFSSWGFQGWGLGCLDTASFLSWHFFIFHFTVGTRLFSLPLF